MAEKRKKKAVVTENVVNTFVADVQFVGVATQHAGSIAARPRVHVLTPEVRPTKTPTTPNDGGKSSLWEVQRWRASSSVILLAL